MRRLAQPASEESRQEAEYRLENRDWLRKSAQIAFAVRRELRIQGLSQQELAERMGVSPQHVGKLLKGKDNLTLETIAKLEKALGCSLVRVRGIPDRPPGNTVPGRPGPGRCSPWSWNGCRYDQ